MPYSYLVHYIGHSTVVTTIVSCDQYYSSCAGVYTSIVPFADATGVCNHVMLIVPLADGRDCSV